MDYVQVSEEEGEEPIELPTEDDGSLLLSTLQAQFPGSCGLKWRNEDNKAVRGVRLADGHFDPPVDKDGWGSTIFFCVFPKENKRKSDDNLENSTPKTKRVESRLRCTDLIVLGLSFKTTEDSLREHFEKYGEVIMSQVKKDFNTGQSKGFGFVRFSKYESQMRVLAARHLIDDRWCEVKIPNSKEGIVHQIPSKIFVGRCTEDISTEDLREYFSKFGEVTDVFIPRPFRAFSFVTFLDPEVAQSLCGEDHIIKGVSVYVSNASPKTDRNRNNQMNGNNYTQFRSNNRGGGDGGGGFSGNNYGGGDRGYNQNHNGYGMSNGSYSMNNGGGGGGNNGPWNNNQNRGNIDMPNLQSLGINSQGSNPNSNQGSNMNNNPLGAGLNLNSVSMNSALIAAALNQWGLLSGNFGGNQNSQDQGSGKTSNSSPGTSNIGASFLSWMAQGGGGGGGSNSQSKNSGQSSVNDSHQGSGGTGGGIQSWARTSKVVSPAHGLDNANNFI